MKKSKKLFCLFITVCIVLSTLFICTLNVGAENVTTYNWEKMGVYKHADITYEEAYNSEGVVNLRCNYSNWDSEKKYLWLISNWAEGAIPSSLYLGENYDMSQVTSITFDYVTNGSKLSGNRVSLTQDPEGTKVVASAQITEATGALKDPKNAQMVIQDTSYNGPVYLFIEYQSKMFVGNLKIKGTDNFKPQLPAKALLPEKTMIPSNAQEGGDNFKGNDSGFRPQKPSIMLPIGASAAVIVIGLIAIMLIWSSKKKTQ